MVCPVRLNVTRPIRAGPVNEPALHSMYMIRGLRPGGFSDADFGGDFWRAAISDARAAVLPASRLDIVALSSLVKPSAVLRKYHNRTCSTTSRPLRAHRVTTTLYSRLRWDHRQTESASHTI